MRELATKTCFNRSALIEALAIFGIFGLLLTISILVDGFEHIAEFSKSHESWELDEILSVLMIMPIALAVYAVRRLIDLRCEFRRRIAAEQEASALAFHDPLTGLPNRRKAYQVIQEAMRHADEERFALALIDLDRFKAINDQYGHIAGDEVLLAAADNLRAQVRQGDLLARLGGDEFIVLLRNFASSEALVARVDEIMGAFARTIRLPSIDSVLTVGASVGVTLVDKAGVEIDGIITQADTAMYRAKALREPSFCFFEQGMDEAAAQLARTERDLRDAIRADRIEPFYQPLIDLSSGKVLGYEALARWRCEDGSIRNPDEFIPIAEECGAIGELYFRLLAKAAHEARRWPDGCFLAVNLSPLQFSDPWLVERTLQTLHLAGLPPGRLEVEITESALVSELETARTVIANFKSQGIKISLDDFGTGYSSLRHLSELAFDKLKIDRSFITNIATDTDSQTIVRAVTSMAHHLGLKVTVEGVETTESECSVRAFGCDFGQGYLYGKPAPVAWSGPQEASAKGSADCDAEEAA